MISAALALRDPDEADGNFDRWLRHTVRARRARLRIVQSRGSLRQQLPANDPSLNRPKLVRQHRLSENTTHASEGRFHRVPRFERTKDGAESETMSFGQSPKTLGELVAAALGRRIGYGITRKQLQHALGVSSGTVDNLLSGHQDPSGRVLMALIGLFDAAFANEILQHTGCTVVKLSDRRAVEAAAKIIEGMNVLNEMQGRAR